MAWHKVARRSATETSRHEPYGNSLSKTPRYRWAYTQPLPSRHVSFLYSFALSVLVSLIANNATAQNATAQSPEIQRDICVVIGAEGQPEYGEAFRAWAKRWQEAFESKADNKTTRLKLIDGTNKEHANESPSSDHQTQLLEWISQTNASQSEQLPQERWLVLIGHGTHDPTQKTSASKFNLQGPDLTPEMITTAMSKGAQASDNQPQTKWIIANCSSCSGPFINALSGSDRIIITATKSGSEQNYARFGDYFSRSLSDPKADLDHDKSVSLLEAFLLASDQTASFYESDGRLASEQSLLDDNGDKRGTPAVFFQGVRPVKAPAENLKLDGLLAKRTVLYPLPDATQLDSTQRTEIEAIENKIEALRGKKKDLPEDTYYEQLENLFRDIIKVRRRESTKGL